MKSLILTLLFVSITTITFSQGTSYGVRGGFNISNLDFDPDADFENKHRNSIAFGGFVDFGISDTFSILTELQYSAEGGKGETLKADYIQLPIMARLSFGDKFTVGVGPMVSLKTWKNRDGFSTFTYSGVGGVEYMLTDELFIDARVHYGLSNILDEDLTDVEAQSTTFQFGFGIKI
ncbi:porin family protein [uncultured Psychroserpens sp.]|uniref:porin family protein n=1 Tax=uncultured Psychroserpens sp. TaxID=255436 RepID=UPI002615E903|nr:porin family protein [uncultured Psychroserpens sp.]